MSANPFPKQLILGHRGSPAEACENTLRSFELAVRAGADGVELDVQRTRDGVPVVIHDDSLDRTMRAQGVVAQLTWPAIERLTGAKTPSLAQVIAWASAADVWLNVELKATGLEESVVELIQRASVGERVIISSFRPDLISRIGALDTNLRRFLLTKRWDDAARSALDESGAGGVCLRIDATSARTLEELEGRKLPVIVWTVNDAEEVRRLLRRGVAGIISDSPAVAVRVRAELGSDGGVA